MDVLIDVLKIFIGAGLGALLGAHCAFLYERKKKKDEEFIKNSSCLRNAQFALFMNMNELHNIYLQSLKNFENQTDRHILMLPLLFTDNNPKLPIDNLSFLTDGIKPDLLGKLVISQTKFQNLIFAFDKRNQMHEEFQKFLSTGKVGIEMDKIQIQLKMLTDSIYTQLPETIVYTCDVFYEIIEVMKLHYTKVKAIDLEDDMKEIVKSFRNKK